MDVPPDVKKVTIQVACRRMKQIAKLSDIETAHVEADKLLCELLKLEGYDKVVRAFDRVDKWYA